MGKENELPPYPEGKKGGEILIMRGGMASLKKNNPARAGGLPLRFGFGFAALGEGMGDYRKSPPREKNLLPEGRVEGLFLYNSEKE